MTTGRRAYEMFTRAICNDDRWYGRPKTQFGEGPLIAYDDLSDDEKRAWKRMAKQIDQRTARSVAARRS